MALDFRKSYLYADMKREVYIELADEDSRKAMPDSVGLRNAPQIWQDVVKNVLEARGVSRRRLNRIEGLPHWRILLPEIGRTYLSLRGKSRRRWAKQGVCS